MKPNFCKILLVSTCLLTCCLTSCTPQLAYQVLETHAPELTTSDKTLSLEYNFWNDGGRITCKVTNISDAPVYLDLNRSHLIVNGEVNDYYQEETRSTAISQRSTAYNPLLYHYGGANSVQSSTSIQSHPKALRQIPPHSFIIIEGLSAVPTRIIQCDLEKWKPGKPVTVTYTEANSPLKFRQFITYSRNLDGTTPQVIDNPFWVERISNMTPSTFRGPSVSNERCGKKLASFHSAMPYAKAGSLYVSFRPPMSY